TRVRARPWWLSRRPIRSPKLRNLAGKPDMSTWSFKRCPLDDSELVFLGGWWNCGNKYDVWYSYCPRCDAGFVYWDIPGKKDLVVFTWRRKGRELLLDPAD